VKAARNIEGVTVIPVNTLNTYEVLKNKNLLLMKECIDTFKEGLKKN
ncbi:MAG: 50S ribosomal protein L4, partial [Candidatus Levybacteria bacterium RBG_13_35_9]